MNKIKFKINERIKILNYFLNKKSDLVTIKVIKKFTEEIQFDEKEIKEQEIVSDQGSIKWKDPFYEKEFKISDIIKKELKEFVDEEFIKAKNVTIADIEFVEKIDSL